MYDNPTLSFFEELSGCSKATAPSDILTSNAHVSQFLHLITNNRCHEYFFTLSIPVGVKQCLHVALISISIRTNGSGQLFKYLMIVWTSSKKCLFKSLPIFNWDVCHLNIQV